jgi:hypothetical protein
VLLSTCVPQVSGQSALHAAAALNQSDAIVELVSAWGADVNLRDQRGATPIIIAVCLLVCLCCHRDVIILFNGDSEFQDAPGLKPSA